MAVMSHFQWSELPLWFAVIVLILAWLVYKIVKLIRHVKSARRIGLPYTVVPVLETEAIGKLITPLVRPLYTQRLLRSKGWPRWIRFTILDWAWEEKRKAHEELGEVFLVVSPGGIICYSADADMSWDVMNRRNEFIKPREKYSMK